MSAPLRASTIQPSIGSRIIAGLILAPFVAVLAPIACLAVLLAYVVTGRPPVVDFYRRDDDPQADAIRAALGPDATTH